MKLGDDQIKQQMPAKGGHLSFFVAQCTVRSSSRTKKLTEL
jgi:hypothetical protein